MRYIPSLPDEPNVFRTEDDEWLAAAVAVHRADLVEKHLATIDRASSSLVTALSDLDLELAAEYLDWTRTIREKLPILVRDVRLIADRAGEVCTARWLAEQKTRFIAAGEPEDDLEIDDK